MVEEQKRPNSGKTAGAGVEGQDSPKYYIDFQWYERKGRSFQVVAQARFCRSCRERLGEEVEERLPTIDPKGGRVVFQKQKVPYGSNPLPVIRSCCSKARDYITPKTPLLEALFRLFLANGNQPSDAAALREQLEQYLPLYSKPHAYAVEFLERMLDADTHYGMGRFALSSE